MHGYGKYVDEMGNQFEGLFEDDAFKAKGDVTYNKQE